MRESVFQPNFVNFQFSVSQFNGKFDRKIASSIRSNKSNEIVMLCLGPIPKELSSPRRELMKGSLCTQKDVAMGTRI